jgi:hypothetical protein
MYAVAGIMQGILLSMCIVWKFRQSKMEVDDFGNSVVVEDATTTAESDELSPPSESTPLIVSSGSASKKGVERGWKRLLSWL